MIAIQFSTEKNQKINKNLQKLANNILAEKNEKEPNIMNIENQLDQINDTKNYKTQGTIIRSKEMTIINEETQINIFTYKNNKIKQKLY